MRLHHDAVHDMAHQHLVRVAYGSEVISLVPLVQHIDIGHQLRFLVFGQRNPCVIKQAGQCIQHDDFSI